jgi:hypothetical protein
MSLPEAASFITFYDVSVESQELSGAKLNEGTGILK